MACRADILLGVANRGTEKTKPSVTSNLPSRCRLFLLASNYTKETQKEENEKYDTNSKHFDGLCVKRQLNENCDGKAATKPWKYVECTYTRIFEVEQLAKIVLALVRRFPGKRRPLS